MVEGNPGEMDFGSSQREVRVSKSSSYWESRVLYKGMIFYLKFYVIILLPCLFYNYCITFTPRVIFIHVNVFHTHGPISNSFMCLLVRPIFDYTFNLHHFGKKELFFQHSSPRSGQNQFSSFIIITKRRADGNLQFRKISIVPPQKELEIPGGWRRGLKGPKI